MYAQVCMCVCMFDMDMSGTLKTNKAGNRIENGGVIKELPVEMTFDQYLNRDNIMLMAIKEHSRHATLNTKALGKIMLVC